MREYRKMLQQTFQEGGMNRYDARRVLYGPTWKQATAPGRGVQLAIPKRVEADNG